jgi:hypothetical protein
MSKSSTSRFLLTTPDVSDDRRSPIPVARCRPSRMPVFAASIGRANVAGAMTYVFAVSAEDATSGWPLL